MTYTCFVGIDPGVKGGMVVLDPHGGIIDAIVMPEPEELRRMFRYFYWDDQPFITLEEPSPDPKWGAIQAWRFAYGIGRLEGIFNPQLMVNPRTWQAKVWRKDLISGKLTGKQKSLITAKAIWPNADFRASKRCKIPHDGMVDAALIAYYGLLTHKKGKPT